MQLKNLRMRLEIAIQKEELNFEESGSEGNFALQINRDLIEQMLIRFVRRCNIIHSLAVFQHEKNETNYH